MDFRVLAPTSIYCIELYCFAQSCTVLFYISKYCTSESLNPCIVQSCSIAQLCDNFTSLHCTTIHWTPQYCSAVQYCSVVPPCHKARMLISPSVGLRKGAPAHISGTPNLGRSRSRSRSSSSSSSSSSRGRVRSKTGFWCFQD